MAGASRDSMSRRSIMWSSWPSRIIAMDGEDGEYRVSLIRPERILQRQTHGGTHASSGASTNRVHDHHRGAGTILERLVDFVGGVEFFDSQTRQFLAHRDDHNFGIHRHVGFIPLVGDSSGNSIVA